MRGYLDDTVDLMNMNTHDVEDALRSVMKHTGDTIYLSLKDDYIFREIKRREDCRALGMIEPEAGADKMERYARTPYTRTEISMVRDMAAGRWADLAGRMASRVEMLHALYDTAECFQTYGIKCCHHFKKMKVCTILAWYEIWRRAVVNLADMYKCMDNEEDNEA